MVIEEIFCPLCQTGIEYIAGRATCPECMIFGPVAGTAALALAGWRRMGAWVQLSRVQNDREAFRLTAIMLYEMSLPWWKFWARKKGKAAQAVDSLMLTYLAVITR